jgi:alpha-ketoglutarate-dependent taurine dioxygenase
MSPPTIEDMYVLSPMQAGLLFHTVGQPNSGVYVTQSAWRLEGRLDIDALKSVWEQIISRHPVLRTTFIWENRDKPLQVVRHGTNLRWEQSDWRGLSPPQQLSELESLFARDRYAGFDVVNEPLMRLFLIQTGADSHNLIWSRHHLLLDGWSASLILGEVFAFYGARVAKQGLTLELPRPYRDYIAWLQQQDASIAEAFWRKTLQSFSHPTPLDGDKAAADSLAEMGRHARKEIRLPSSVRIALQETTRRFQITFNTLIVGAWALYLGHYAGKDDVVFGQVVSGRPAELAGIEGMIGLFINTLPVRVRFVPGIGLASWLRQIQNQQAESQQFEYSALTQIKAWSDIAPGLPLFESILVFQNVPKGSLPENQESNDGFKVSLLKGNDQNSFPLTLTVGMNPDLTMEINYDCDRFEDAAIGRILERVETLLREIIKHPDMNVMHLIETLAEDDRRRRIMEREKARESSLSRFKSIKPKAISVNSDDIVKMEYIQPGQPLPLVFKPKVSDADLIGWASSNRELVERKLYQHGAILFRQFRINLSRQFEEFASAVCSELLGGNGEHNRTSVSGNVYTPVSYPKDQHLLWHNENSFNHRWPTKVLFSCVQPAAAGGETPLVDSRNLLKEIPDQIKHRFISKGVMYVRSYGEGLGLSWQEVFQTSRAEEAEAQLRNNLMEFEWKDGGRLQTRCTRPAVVRHPKTGEDVWFNQAQHWHPSCLGPEIRQALRRSFDRDDILRNCFFGDGSEISEQDISEILAAYGRLEVRFAWQAGDILLVDNLLAAHARTAYTGERQLLVAMGEMLSYDDVDH